MCCQENFMVKPGKVITPWYWKPGIGLSISNSWVEQTGTARMAFCFHFALSVRSQRTQTVTHGLERWLLRTGGMICWSTGQLEQKLPVSVKPCRETHFEMYCAWSWLHCFTGSSSSLPPGDSFNLHISFFSHSKPIYDPWVTEGKRIYLEVNIELSDGTITLHTFSSTMGVSIIHI